MRRDFGHGIVRNIRGYPRSKSPHGEMRPRFRVLRMTGLFGGWRSNKMLQCRARQRQSQFKLLSKLEIRISRAETNSKELSVGKRKGLAVAGFL
jgi:hypothetical protein